VQLTITYRCPESTGTAFLGAAVSQPETEAFANLFVPIPVACTGEWETITPVLHYPGSGFFPFALGHADAGAILSGLPASRERKVRIVE
jgi:hypothetical protein